MDCSMPSSPTACAASARGQPKQRSGHAMLADQQKQQRYGHEAKADAADASVSAGLVADEVMDVDRTDALGAGSTEAAPAPSSVVACDWSSSGLSDVGQKPQQMVQDSEAEAARKAPPTRLCVVCGDRAQGFNFNAVTCQSCKAFFRRSAVKVSELKCAMSGDCHLDVHTRRFCPACRLRKCYATGMKRELILDDTEKARRKEKVLRNREEKLRALKEAHGTVAAVSVSPSAALTAGTKRHGCSSVQVCRAAEDAVNGPNLSPDVVAEVQAAVPLRPGYDGSAAAFGNEPFRRVSYPGSAATKAPAWPPLPDADVERRRSADGTDSEASSSQTACRAEAVGERSSSCSELQSSSGGVQRTVCVVHPFSPTPTSSASLLPVTAQDEEPGTVLASSRAPVDRQPLLLHELPLRRMLTDREAVGLSNLGSSFLRAFCPSSGDGGRGPSASDSFRDSGPKFFAHRAKFLLRGLAGFASTLRDFSELPKSAQASLLRSSVISCMVLRSVQLYDPAAEQWNDGHGTVFCEAELNLTFAGEADMFRQSAALARSFKQLFSELPVTSVKSTAVVSPSASAAGGRQPFPASASDDSVLYALLHAILVLSPEYAVSKAGAATAVESRDVFGDVSDAQQHYASLLRRHLESTYSFACAADLLPSLLQRLSMYKCFSQQARRLVSALEPLEPVLRCLPR